MIVLRKFFFWIYILSSMLCLSACNGMNKLNAQEKIRHTQNEFIELNGVKIPAATKLVFNDINIELKEKKVSLSDYVPSEKLVRKHHLQYRNEQYYIRGTVRFGAKFNAHSLTQNGIESGTTTKRFVTVTIPVQRLNDFFKIEGIEYFETSNKATLK